MRCRRAFWALLLALATSLPLAAQDSWTGVERVVAVGDVHGDADQLLETLRSAGLIDAAGDWAGGKAHLVQTGDLLDRGPDSRRAMDVLMKLEKQAVAAGGRVHCLIGNHEAMNLTGDLSYVSEGEIAAFRDADSEKTRAEAYAAHQKELRETRSVDTLPDFDDDYRKRWEAQTPLGFVEHRRAFSPSGPYGKWIRGLNTVVKIDRTIFLHGGLSPKYAEWTLARINGQVRAELADFSKLRDGIVDDDAGPMWYRGLARRDGRFLEEQVRAVLAAQDCDRVVIGHTTTPGAILSRLGGRVIQIDVGMSKVYDPRGKVACLRIEQGKPMALHRGKALELPKDDGKDLLRYLKEAAALDPAPSPLQGEIELLEFRLLDPAAK